MGSTFHCVIDLFPSAVHFTLTLACFVMEEYYPFKDELLDSRTLIARCIKGANFILGSVRQSLECRSRQIVRLWFPRINPLGCTIYYLDYSHSMHRYSVSKNR
jgi:hypothetical protein